MNDKQKLTIALEALHKLHKLGFDEHDGTQEDTAWYCWNIADRAIKRIDNDNQHRRI